MDSLQIAQAIGMVGAPEIARLAGVSERAVYRARTRGRVADTAVGKRLAGVFEQVLTGAASGRGRKPGPEPAESQPAPPAAVDQERRVGLVKRTEEAGLARARRVGLEAQNAVRLGELVPVEEVRFSRQQAGAAMRTRFDEARRDLEGVACSGCRPRVMEAFERAAGDIKAGVSNALATPFKGGA